MACEIDLMKDYPRSARDVVARGAEKTEEDRRIARRFGREFFDGERRHGYGGFEYHPRFWEPVIPAFQKHFALTGESSVLDGGCAKGFMLYDLSRMIPGIHVAGIDVSSYAIENAKEEVRAFVKVGDVREMPFESDSVDVVFSINTLHNLELQDLERALREIERVQRRGSFITVDAYRNDAEQERMNAWNLTAKTVLHVDGWKNLFTKVGYTGDYYWFIA
ncbi:MAG: class I SAM-dependent methyltransferase [Bdellovibrionota bacterium]